LDNGSCGRALTIPSSSAPQHAGNPSCLIAHVVSLPALTSEYDPEGASDLKFEVLPQQTIDPSILRPHVWVSPAVIFVKVPSGARAWLWMAPPFPDIVVSAPQQVADPSTFSAQT
jgi:hypothetical protein